MFTCKSCGAFYYHWENWMENINADQGGFHHPFGRNLKPMSWPTSSSCNNNTAANNTWLLWCRRCFYCISSRTLGRASIFAWRSSYTVALSFCLFNGVFPCDVLPSPVWRFIESKWSTSNISSQFYLFIYFFWKYAQNWSLAIFLLSFSGL